MSHPSPLRRLVRSVSTRVIYRADQYLAWPPLVQIALVLAVTTLLLALFGRAVQLAFPHDPDLDGMGGIWWATTRFMDGGTMASDPPDRHGLALGATVFGVLAVSFLTGAFASKMGERIADLRSGRTPVLEKGHLLVLGFDSKVTLIARELARSGQRLFVVTMAQQEKATVEFALRPARRIHGNRARFVVRTGDPRSERDLLRVATDATRGIVIVPPSSLDDEASVHWTLSTLLAVRRTVGADYRGSIVVEARHEAARSLLELAAEPGVAGPGALPVRVVASDAIVARILAQSARQEGIYFALREMLSFVGSEVYIDPAPRALVGKTFEEAHECLEGGILLGFVRANGTRELFPERGASGKLARDDRIVVLARASGAYRFGGKFGPRREVPAPDAAHAHARRVETVLVIGFNPTLRPLLRELDETLTDGSRVVVMACPIRTAVASVLSEIGPTLTHVRVEHDSRRPVDLTLAMDASLPGVDAVVILGCENENDENGDASALATLLWLRHGVRATHHSLRRVVTEVRDLRSALHVQGSARDFLVSTDVVAMLLAQCALEREAGAVYDALLSATGGEIFLRPRTLYVGDREATFADVMVAAHARDEIALGLYPIRDGLDAASLRDTLEGERGEETRSPAYLNPPRDTRVPAGPDTHVIVLAHPERGLAPDSAR